MFNPSRIIFSTFMALALFMPTQGAEAAQFPTRSMTLVVPFAAGGGTDIVARILGASMEKTLNKTLVVVNKTGAGGVLGMSDIAKSAPNGYNLGFVPYPEIDMMPQIKKTPFSAQDFTYIGMFGTSPTCFIVRKDAPYKTLEDLLAHAKKNPDSVTVSVAGDSHLLSVVLLEAQTGVKFTPVRYKSGSEAFNALLGGHVDTAMIAPRFGDLGLQQGLPVVGVSSEQRFPMLQDIPTFKEQGYDVIMELSQILIAPKATPESVVNILRDACLAASKDAAFSEKITKAGYNTNYYIGDNLKEYVDQKNAIYLPSIQTNLERFRQ